MGFLGPLAAGIMGGSSLLSSIIGGNAAGNAASAQATAAEQAAMLQWLQSQQALGLQRDIFGIQSTNELPYQAAGVSSLSNLASLMGVLPPDSTTAQLGKSSQLPTQTAAPRFGGTTIHDSHGIWTYQGSDNGVDVYSRTAGGSPAWLTMGPNGRQSAQGAYPGQFTPAGQPMQGGTSGPGGTSTSGTAGQTTSPSPLSSYVNPSLGAAGSLQAPFQTPFQAPTDVTEQNDPGYKFRLEQGDKLLENSAAARGGLLSGGTAKALEQYGQDYASNEYGKVYDRALNQYQLNQNNALQRFNLLSSLAGGGQVATSTINQAGSNLASDASSTLLAAGQQVGQNLNNAGAARASGYVGGSNALQGGMNGLSNLALLYSMMNGGNSGSGGGSIYDTSNAPIFDQGGLVS